MPRHVLQPLPRALSGHREAPNPRHHVLQDDGVWDKLDRCQVLGDSSHGHSGCVNALSWSEDGSTLLSGSDDKRICIWSADPSASSSTSPHPLKLVDSIATGHRANIFSAKFLPNTSSATIVSCAGDNGVRVFDVEKLGRAEVGIGMNSRDELWGFSGPGVRVLRCHTDRTKRIATENSPFLFLSVSEDGTVRQHDLRRPHVCRSECPEPLFRAPRGIDLYSLSVSSVTPHMFAVAGRTDCAYLCDRRMLERQTPSWGAKVQSSEQVHCVRRLGMTSEQWQKDQPNGSVYLPERHITCVKMSPHHADEVICAFASHSTGIFSTYDSPGPSSMRQRSGSPTIIPNNSPRRSTRHPKLPYSAEAFERDSSPRLGKRRQSALSSVATNPDPGQRPRSQAPDPDSHGIKSDDPGPSQPPLFTGVGSGKESQNRAGGVAEEPPGVFGLARAIIENTDADGLGAEPLSIDREVTVEAGHHIISDEPTTPERIRERMRRLLSRSSEDPDADELADLYESEGMDFDLELEDEDEDDFGIEEDDEDEDDPYDDEDDDMDDDFGDAMDHFMPPARSTVFDGVDMITPRRNFKGAKNMDTVKDCNFLGTKSDKVCSGSDDGNFFVWDKETGRLEGIWEGDGSVVNVMEQHPSLPLLAVSGIDSTAKLFAPLAQPPHPSFSRLHLRESIFKSNLEQRPFLSRGGFASVSLFDFLAERGFRAETDEDGEPQCPTQ